MTVDSTQRSKQKRLKHSLAPAIAICCFLAAITWVVFSQTLYHGFVNYDDDTYVYKNPHVIYGLTVNSLIWAFARNYASNWHPLTWISHMLDTQLWGLNAGGHHFTNVLLHTISVILLFLVLRQATGTLWRSAFVAAVFAIHPLHVESVAWIAERKDILSGLFFFLTVGAYVHYVCSPSLWRYLLVALLLALGLMCKPTLVTTPFVLLLLDYWPLGRSAIPVPLEIPVKPPGSKSWLFLFIEKIPLLSLSAASCVITVWAQRGGIASDARLPFVLRIENALVSYVAYVWQMIWPARLAVFYPHPENHLPPWQVGVATLLLAIMTGVALVLRKKRPYLITGWLWYLGMLVPVIGLVQVGIQARADRYTYLSQIGLYLMVTWAAVDALSTWRHRGRVLAPVAMVVVATLAWRATIQTSYWRNSQTLWTHALAVTSKNAVAHLQFGNFFLDRDQLDNAIDQYQLALKIRPAYLDAENNLGLALTKKGRINEAVGYLKNVIRRFPNYAQAYYNLGIAFAQQGKSNEAISYYRAAVQNKPDYAEAYYAMGDSFLAEKRFDEAIAQYRRALDIQPGYAEARNNMAVAFLQKGNVSEAVQQWQQTVQLKPDFLDALNNLAWLLATFPEASVRNGARAVELAERADRLSNHQNAAVLRTLAAAYAEAGRFDKAKETAKRGAELARREGDMALASLLDSDIDHYDKDEPVRMPGRRPGE